MSMRLVNKITLLYVILMLIVFIIGGFLTFKMVKNVVRQETDYTLFLDTQLVIQSIKEGNPISALENAKVSIDELPMSMEERNSGVFIDTLMLHRFHKTLEPFRKRTSTHKINGKHYSISLADVFIEQEDMSEGVIETMVRLFLLLSAIFLIFSLFFSNWLLTPFHKTLNHIRQFSIRSKEMPALPSNGITEFDELNRFVTNMMSKAKKDYASLKEFSENASHEMQTPLAVVQGKLELLQDSELLKEEELTLISESQKAVSRLSRLGQALALITKIDNKEYTANGQIDIGRVAKDIISSYQDLANLREISISQNIASNINVNMDEALAEIMVGNLVKNAVQHNIDKGWIQVEVDKEKLVVRNSGMAITSPTNELFHRFKKGNQSSESLGLGLSIVEQICDLNEFSIEYTHDNGEHEITIHFQND